MSSILLFNSCEIKLKLGQLPFFNKYNIPYPVIEVICNSPFKFAKEVMSNDEDTKDIMFAYLFKLKLKKFKI